MKPSKQPAKLGRPSQGRTRPVQTRLTEEEFDALCEHLVQRRVKDRMVSLSEVVAELVRKGLGL